MSVSPLLHGGAKGTTAQHMTTLSDELAGHALARGEKGECCVVICCYRDNDDLHGRVHVRKFLLEEQ